MAIKKPETPTTQRPPLSLNDVSDQIEGTLQQGQTYNHLRLENREQLPVKILGAVPQLLQLAATAQSQERQNRPIAATANPTPDRRCGFGGSPGMTAERNPEKQTHP